MAAYEILIADDHPLFRSLHQALSLGLGASNALGRGFKHYFELELRVDEGVD